MSDKEKIDALIAYLHVLSNVQKNSDVKCHSEIRRVVEKLQDLLID